MAGVGLFRCNLFISSNWFLSRTRKFWPFLFGRLDFFLFVCLCRDGEFEFVWTSEWVVETESTGGRCCCYSSPPPPSPSPRRRYRQILQLDRSCSLFLVSHSFSLFCVKHLRSVKSSLWVTFVLVIAGGSYWWTWCWGHDVRGFGESALISHFSTNVRST